MQETEKSKDLRSRPGILFIPTNDMDRYVECVQAGIRDIGFVPYRVELMYDRNGFEMIGCAEKFDKIDTALGERIPTYRLDIDGVKNEYVCVVRQGK